MYQRILLLGATWQIYTWYESSSSYFSFGHQKFQNQEDVPFYAQGTPFVTPLNTFHERQFYQPAESRQNEPIGITNIYFRMELAALKRFANIAHMMNIRLLQSSIGKASYSDGRRRPTINNLSPSEAANVNTPQELLDHCCKFPACYDPLYELCIDTCR